MITTTYKSSGAKAEGKSTIYDNKQTDDATKRYEELKSILSAAKEEGKSTVYEAVPKKETFESKHQAWMQAYLADAPGKVNTCHTAITDNEVLAKKHSKIALEAALEAGRVLAKVKEILPQVAGGSFRQWFKKNITAFKEVTAYRYMELYSYMSTVGHDDCESIREAYLAAGIIKRKEDTIPAEETDSYGESNSNNAGTSTANDDTEAEETEKSKEQALKRDGLVVIYKRAFTLLNTLIGFEADRDALNAIKPFYDLYKSYLEQDEVYKQRVAKYKDLESFLETTSAKPKALKKAA